MCCHKPCTHNTIKINSLTHVMIFTSQYAKIHEYSHKTDTSHVIKPTCGVIKPAYDRQSFIEVDELVAGKICFDLYLLFFICLLLKVYTKVELPKYTDRWSLCYKSSQLDLLLFFYNLGQLSHSG